MFLQALIIVFFLLFTFLYWFTSIYQNDKLKGYLSLLSGFATLIAIISFFLSVENSRREADARHKDEEAKEADSFAQETQRYWIDLENMFREAYPYLAPLYAEIYSDNPNLPQVTLTPDQQTEAQAKQEHACQILFQTIENIILTRLIMEDAEFGWYQTFLSWSKSKIFQDNWAYSKKFYNPVTQDFIDGLLSGGIKNERATRKFLRERGAR